MASLTAALRRVRDAAADAAAVCAARSPIAERLFIAGAARLVQSPRFYGVARRGMHTLSERLRDGGAPIRRLRVGPASFLIDITGDVLREAYLARIPCEPLTTDWLIANLSPGDLFVDVGANLGYYSLLAAALVGPHGRVVAFEPNPAVRSRLVEHVALNAQQRVITVWAAALGARDAAATLYVPARAAESGLASLHLTPALIDRSPSAVSVSLKRLDSCVSAAALGAARVMKLDVEGGETDVLAGATAWLSSSPPAHILCETTWEGAAHRVLTTLGYEAAMLDVFDRERGLANILFSR
jgi:FkbM family methyltransferase